MRSNGNIRVSSDGTATRDIDNASFGVVGVLVTASLQPAASAAIHTAALIRLSA
jgi:hypothetical protein